MVKYIFYILGVGKTFLKRDTKSRNLKGKNGQIRPQKLKTSVALETVSKIKDNRCNMHNDPKIERGPSKQI